MDSALAEFSRSGYGASSVNTICAAQDVSKGIVYHYFETKDALYLACVEECFQHLTEYIRENLTEESAAKCRLEEYFAIRTGFFREYPVYQRIFCEAVISPPAHLQNEIRERKADFDALNLKILDDILSRLSLRPDISKVEVIETFRMFQDFINIHYQMPDADGRGFEAREENCLKALNILLYGVIESK